MPRRGDGEVQCSIQMRCSEASCARKREVVNDERQLQRTKASSRLGQLLRSDTRHEVTMAGGIYMRHHEMGKSTMRVDSCVVEIEHRVWAKVT